MSRFTSFPAAVLLSIAAIAAVPATAQTATPAEPATEAVIVKPFGVFVDPESRFVFVKLPAGWKFVGALSEAEVRALPSTVLTSLLPPDPQRLEAQALSIRFN